MGESPSRARLSPASSRYTTRLGQKAVMPLYRISASSETTISRPTVRPIAVAHTIGSPDEPG